MESDDQTWAPASSSEKTNAVYKNPFGFSLQVIKSGEDITLASHGIGVAQVCGPRTMFTTLSLCVVR